MKEKQNMKQKLLDIAQELHFIDLYHALQNIQQREEQPNCPLVLPLVGEFSSGKTTLLNALMDSKGLETAAQPTTATIYEIFFGSNKCYAEVIDENNRQILVENIADAINAKFEYVNGERPYLHPGITADIICDGEKIGWLSPRCRTAKTGRLSPRCRVADIARAGISAAVPAYASLILSFRTAHESSHQTMQ